MICKVEKITATYLHGRAGEYKKDVYQLTWKAPHKTIITSHDSFSEVLREMRKHQMCREIYKQEDKAIANWYEQNRRNGSNWTGD